ncbi:MAG: hypothetical protein K2M95_04140, partial [Clostridiales bacterium]|nr:hypothetical protein [Clostridiales bacterium]
DYGLGGGGGSNYFNTSKVTKVTNTQGGRSGDGAAKITMLNYAPKQSSVPTFTINRHADTTITFAGASGTANCLLGSDPENETITSTNTAAYKGIFMTNDTSVITSSTGATQKADAPTNSWLAYSFAADRRSMTIRATRYWTGEKQFYVRVSDTYTYNSVSETNGVWFSFKVNAVEGGELKKDKTLPATMADDFKFGKSTTQVPTEEMKRETSPLRFASVEVTEARRRLIQ